MSNSNPEARIREICKILNNKQNKIYRIDTIIELLATKDIKASRRTIQSDLAYLRKINAPFHDNAGKGNIEFNFTNIYSYELEGLLNYQEKEALEQVRILMEQYSNVEEFDNLRQAINKVIGCTNYEPIEFVQPELKPLKKGFKYFKLLYSAIKEGLLVELVYFPNYTDKGKSYSIKPLMLKESSGMWYCIAKVDNERIRAFSIDRITYLTISKEENPNKDIPDSIDIDYTNAFGIVIPENIKKPTKIILAFEKTLGDMFENRPFHPSQKIIARNAQEVIIQYQILYKLDDDKRIMRELHRELCKYAGSIRIIEPIELKNEYCEMLQKGIEMNK
jgi:predicted DNA-binding transcriptional regulator YafY